MAERGVSVKETAYSCGYPDLLFYPNFYLMNQSYKKAPEIFPVLIFLT